MAFHDVDFPLRLSFGATGGPGQRVEIVELANGREARNTRQSGARRRYNAVSGVNSPSDARALCAFYEARSGALHAFRFRDPIDHVAEDEPIGTGDGVRTQFQLTRTHGEVVRPITKPVPGTVVVSVEGQPVSASVDALTGIVTIAAPPDGGRVTASFTFDVPVRFDTDQLSLSLDTHGAIGATDIPLVEVFDA